MVKEGRIKPISSLCNCIVPTHMMYADNIMVFCQAILLHLLALWTFFRSMIPVLGKL